MATISIHPAVDNGVKPGSPSFAGGTLLCKCASNPVEVTITPRPPTITCADARSAGSLRARCSRKSRSCRATSSMSARTPTGSRSWTPTPRSSGMPARLAAFTCTAASRTPSIRSTGSISSTPSFRRTRAGRPPNSPRSSPPIIESGARRIRCGAVRARLKELRLEPYDCLSPALMDAIATHVAKAIRSA